jgi:creatinine amidohydrolase
MMAGPGGRGVRTPARTIALLPVAAIEQHDSDLPRATDAPIDHRVEAQSLQRLPPSASVQVLPALTIGDSLEHTASPGTPSTERDDLLGLRLGVGRSLARAGVKKSVMFDSQGGQRVHSGLATLQLRVHHGLLAVEAHRSCFGLRPGLFEAEELAHGRHGGALETSLAMHLRPDLLRTAKPAGFPSLSAALACRGELPGAEDPARIGWMTHDLNAQGACSKRREGRAAAGLHSRQPGAIACPRRGDARAGVGPWAGFVAPNQSSPSR